MAFQLNPAWFPMPTLEQGGPFGGALSNSIKQRLSLAQAQTAEEKLPYVGKKDLADLIHQRLVNQYYVPNIESEMGLRGAHAGLAREQTRQARVSNDQEAAVLKLLARLNAQGNLGSSGGTPIPSNQSVPYQQPPQQQNVAPAPAQPSIQAPEVNAPQIPNMQLNAPKPQDLNTLLNRELSGRENVQALSQVPKIPETIDQSLQQEQQQEQQQQPAAQANEAPQEQPQSQAQNQTQTIVPGRPDLSHLDEAYDANPLLRRLLEKHGLKKKVEMKFDTKTGQTRIVTTYPSGKITMQSVGLGQAGDGIPLTNAMITKNQKVISSVDVAIPIIEKIIDLKGILPDTPIPDFLWNKKGLSPYPLSSLGIPSIFGGTQAVYDSLVNQTLDSLMGAFGLPLSNEGLKTVKDQVEIRHFESQNQYRKRMRDLIEELKTRRNYSANEVKKSNKIQPVGRGGAEEGYSSNEWEHAE